MTFKCLTVHAATQVLQLLATTPGWTLSRLKNRLRLEYDAASTGGYRDMLINLTCDETGHIVEVQITLDPLLQIKQKGGHFNYSLARLFSLFEGVTYRHEGTITTRVLEGMRFGLIRELILNGNVSLPEKFESLCRTIRDPSCVLIRLEIAGSGWPTSKCDRTPNSNSEP